MVKRYMVYVGNNPDLVFGQQYCFFYIRQSPCKCKAEVANLGVKANVKEWWCSVCKDGYELNSESVLERVDQFITIEEWEKINSLITGL